MYIESPTLLVINNKTNGMKLHSKLKVSFLYLLNIIKIVIKYIKNTSKLIKELGL